MIFAFRITIWFSTAIINKILTNERPLLSRLIIDEI